MTADIPDPIRRTAELITANIDFDKDVIDGDFFADLPAPLQGIAISRCEGALAFYNRIGWHPDLLHTPLESCIAAENMDTLQQRYHAKDLHDLAYVHPKHFEKMLGKAGSASLWEELKRLVVNITSSDSAATGAE